MNDETPQSIHPDKPGNGTLFIYLFCTFVAVTVIALSAMLMALGSGLGSSSDEPVPQASMALWGISGLSFLPCMVLVILVIGTHRRPIAMALGLTVIIAGLLTAVGWFINSGGEMPGNTTGDVIVIAVIAVPLVMGAIMIWRSSVLKN